MKYIFTVLLAGFCLLGFSQVPSLINYQGIARDTAGVPVVKQAIALRFEILQGSTSGPVIFTENQLSGITTNAIGLFNTQIGKNANLGQINWKNGPYFLQVSIDPAGGSNLVVLGTQEIVSVPFASLAGDVPSTFTNNVLTIGSQTHAIATGTAVSITSTGTNVTVAGGPNYTLSYSPPLLALSPNNASLSIVGGNTITLPPAVTPTLVPSGIATVTNGVSSYTVGVPAPSYNQNSGVLTMGSSNTVVTPTLGLSGGVLYSGPFTNSVALPSVVTVAGSGIANVTGGPSYVVNVPPPTLALSSNNLSISIVGSNSVALPAPVTIAAPANNIVSVSGGPTNYTVSAPNPVYTGTALILGASTTTVAPTLVYNSGVLTSGPTSNSVSLTGLGPFTQAGTSVSLTTVTDNLALGLSSASAKLDVYSNAATGNVIRATNVNSGNTAPAVEISSNGNTALNATNTSPGGVAADFSATNGYAVKAVNTTNLNATIYAENTNASGLSGYFKGSLVTESKLGQYAFNAKNSSSSDIFVIRDDGSVGIGVTTPAARLDVNGNLRLSGGNLYLGGVGGVNSGYTGLYANGSGDLTFAVFKTGAAATAFGNANSMDAVTILNNSGNVGIGTTAPAAKLDIAGSVKIVDGSQGAGKVLTSDASGAATWAPVSVTTTSIVSVQSLSNVTDIPTDIGSPLASFTKVYNDTRIQVILQTHIFVYDLIATNSAKYELRIGSTPALANTGKVNYFLDNNNSLNVANYNSVTIIAEFPAMAAGSYNLNLLISAVNAGGTASGAYIDPGSFNASSVIIKEYR